MTASLAFWANPIPPRCNVYKSNIVTVIRRAYNAILLNQIAEPCSQSGDTPTGLVSDIVFTSSLASDSAAGVLNKLVALEEIKYPFELVLARFV